MKCIICENNCHEESINNQKICHSCFKKMLEEQAGDFGWIRGDFGWIRGDFGWISEREKLQRLREKLVMENTSYNTTKEEFDSVQDKLLFIQGQLKVYDEFVGVIKDWFQLLKDNNQYEDFIKYYGDLWEEVFSEVEE